jgi:hypothetical protein
LIAFLLENNTEINDLFYPSYFGGEWFLFKVSPEPNNNHIFKIWILKNMSNKSKFNQGITYEKHPSINISRIGIDSRS